MKFVKDLHCKVKLPPPSLRLLLSKAVVCSGLALEKVKCVEIMLGRNDVCFSTTLQ